MKEKVVVFGGSGFLGSHVADALSEQGFEVVIYDLKRSPYLKKRQIMVEADVLDEIKVNKVLKDVDYAYNFSGISDIDRCSKEIIAAVRSNMLGHAIILNGCARYKIKRIIYASSIYVYGRHGSFYRVTKQSCEQLTEQYYEQHRIPYTILRYGSLYGPRAQKWNGVYKYIYQAVKENKINYDGSGDEKREYIHVLDAARLSTDVLRDNGYKNKCVVITGQYTLSSRDLLTMISEMLSNKVKINFTQKPSPHHYNITPYAYSPTIGIKLTANPSIDMGEGIFRQIEEMSKR